MLSIKSRITQESTSTPGVSFTVRTLNKIQRAERDLPIAEQAFEFGLVSEEYFSLLPKGWTERESARKRVAKLSVDQPDSAELAAAKEELRVIEASVVDTPEAEKRRRFLDYRAGLLRDLYIKPAAIQAALVSVAGLEIDGVPATPETLLDHTGADYDALIEEIYQSCESAAGLSADQQKNSQSPTISSAPAAGDLTDSGATSAGG